MAIEILHNQPIDLDPVQIDPCNRGDGIEYCTRYNIGDTIYLQWKQRPCGDDLNCDPTLQSVGDNLILNGAFDISKAGWQMHPEVDYDESNEALKWTAGGSSPAAWIEINVRNPQAGATLIPGASYSVSFTVAGRTAGSITPSLGGTNGTVRSSNATFTETIVAGSTNGDLKFTASGTFDGRIDNVILTLVASCLTVDAGWTADGGGGLVHAPGTVDDIDIDIDLVSFTGYQQITVRVEDGTDGTLYAYNGNVLLSPSMYSSGTYVFYISNANDFTFKLRSDLSFNGRVVEVNVYELVQDYSAAILDMDGTVIDDVSASLSYEKDYVTLAYDSSMMSEGCYRVQVYDYCFDYPDGSELNTDEPFASSTGWTFVDDTDLTGSIAGGKYLMEADGPDPGVFATLNRAITWPTNAGYVLLRVSFTTGDFDTAGGHTVNLGVPAGGSGVLYHTISSNVQANSSYSKTFLIYVDNTNPSTSVFNSENIFNKFEVVILNTGIAENDIDEFLNFSIEHIPSSGDGYPYLSNCIDVGESHDCAKLIEGYLPEEGYANGFYFPNGSDFKISSRYRFLKFNPFYPIDDSSYQYSDGTRRRSFSQREKYYEGKLDYMDETAHDAFSAAMLCDTFEIDGEEYFVKGDDYKPDWQKDGNKWLSQANILLRKIAGTIYNNNG